MLNKKKLLSSVLMTTLILSLLVGCNNSANNSANNETTAKTAETTKASGGNITAMYVGTETDAVVSYYKQFVEDFNETNSLGVTCDIQFYENEQYKTKLTTLMASDSVPDMFFTWELDYLKPFVNGGKVYDMTALLDADTELKDSFQEGVLEPLTYDGKVYALPSQTTFTPMFYNKQIFTDNGLSIPTTWDEFIQVCDTLKAAGITPISIPAPDAWIPAQFVQQLVNGIGGMDIYNGLLDGTVAWNNETHVQAGQLVQTIIDAGYLQDGFLGMSSEEGEKLMKDGKCGMYFMGAWEISTLTADDCAIKDHVGAFALPAYDSENDNIHVGSVDSSMAISAKSKNPEAAFALIKHWVSKENQETLLYEAGRIPATKIEVDTTKITSLMAECLEISNKTVGLTPWLDRAFGAGEGVEFNNTCQSIYGGEDVQTCFDDLQKYVEDNADN